MDNYGMKVQATVDLPSAKKVDEQIRALEKSISKLKVSGKFDDVALKNLTNQLNTLKATVASANFSPTALKELASQVEKALANINISSINIGNIGNGVKQAGQQIGQVISDSADKAIGNVTSKNIGKYFRVSQSDSHQFQAEMEKLVSEWTNGKGKVTDVNIQTRTSYDEKEKQNIERLHQATVTYKNELDEVIKKTIAWRQIGTTVNDKGEEVALRGFVEVAGQYSKSIDTVSDKTDNFAKRQKETVANLQNTINQITSRAFDTNSSKPITSEASLNKLNTQVAYVENAMHDLRNATASTFDDAKLKVQEEVSALKILEKELRNSDNVATKMKGTDISSGISIAKNDLEKFKADAKDFPQIKKTIDDLDVAISKVGDASSLNSFNDQLRVARTELAKVKSEVNATNRNEKVGINVSGLQSKIADLQRISPEIDKFETEINGAKVTVQSLLTDLSNVNTQSDFSVVNSKWKAFTDSAKAAGIAVTEVATNSQSLTNKINIIQLSMDTGETESKVDALIAKTNQWTDVNGNARISTQSLTAALDALGLASNEYIKTPTEENQKKLIEANEKLSVEYKKVASDIRSMNADLAKDSAIDSLRQQYQNFYSENGKAHRQFGNQLKSAIAELASGAEIPKQRLDELKKKLVDTKIQCKELGLTGQTWFQNLGDKIKSLTTYLSGAVIISKVTGLGKDGISRIIELDTALVDLKKTTKMTNNELEDFYYKSNDVAKQLGVTTKEIIDQAAAWSRLGFNTAEAATKMAQYSSKFASISPGMSTDEAQEGLVSIIKAWGLDVEDVEREVMDNINSLGNSFAESNIDLVNGMKRSAAALAATGTTYQDAFALFTGAQEVVQNAEVTGRALRSISMRIHGYSEDSEDGLMELDEELQNVTGDLIDLTKTAEHSQGVSIFKDGSNTEFKSLVEYFGEINEIWDEMSQKQQNDFLDKAFGKNQAQAGAAIIQNYEAIAEAIEVMEGAAGSSEREMSIIMDSLDYKINKTKETATGIFQNLFKKEDMKSVVDGANSILGVLDKITEKLGLFGTAGIGGATFLGRDKSKQRFCPLWV